MTPEVDLDRVWRGIAAQVWRRRPGIAERLAGRLLRSPGLARALLTTPSLLLPWLMASAIVLGAGVAATLSSHQPVVGLLAPAMAGVAIAFAYGPDIDPAWELSRSMAVSDRMVLLVRALAVFAENAVLGLIASAASGLAAQVTVGWLVPMTAVCAFALAVATVTESAVGGAAAGLACWTITVLSVRVTSGQFAAVVTSGALVLPYLAVALIGVAVAAAAPQLRPRMRLRLPRGMF